MISTRISELLPLVWSTLRGWRVYKRRLTYKLSLILTELGKDKRIPFFLVFSFFLCLSALEVDVLGETIVDRIMGFLASKCAKPNHKALLRAQGWLRGRCLLILFVYLSSISSSQVEFSQMCTLNFINAMVQKGSIQTLPALGHIYPPSLTQNPRPRAAWPCPQQASSTVNMQLTSTHSPTCSKKPRKELSELWSRASLIPLPRIPLPYTQTASLVHSVSGSPVRFALASSDTLSQCKSEWVSTSVVRIITNNWS